MKYKLGTLTTAVGNYDFILREDGVQIPFDPANVDYQAYLAWIAEGNTPEPWENTNGPE